MKKFLENAKNWLVFGLFASFVIIVSLFIYSKARQTANPWLTEGSPTGGLYVGANETLSSAKRNVLVKRWTREDVATTDTANFDGSCERRYLDDAWRYPSTVSNTRLIREFNWAASRYWVKNITKGSVKIYNTDTIVSWRAAVSKIQKKCQ